MEHHHIERARKELQQASDAAGRTMQEQLDSLQEGLFEEDAGEMPEDESGPKTQAEPGPKIDRITEMRDKLGGLEEQAESAETIDHISAAREHLREYIRTHPQGG